MVVMSLDDNDWRLTRKKRKKQEDRQNDADRLAASQREEDAETYIYRERDR